MTDNPGDRAEAISDAERWAWARYGKPVEELDSVEREELLKDALRTHIGQAARREARRVELLLAAEVRWWLHARRNEIRVLEKQEADEVARSLDRLEQWANEEMGR
ncbi:hypothetical protein [Nocardia mangyaensis]|uniref:hypothetical protein n=1 Tax=Nocardia mangyaensis TaxID=2213200 RepID=UPI002674BEB0|nr:hypothetical protein [Nocardia mangyaensis]MDO3647680.1 hypothetical protein [Nocardia mangyaensis]